MKKILIATDFSANAAHAARYGCSLATQAKAHLILCNAFTIPVEVPEGGILAWPIENDELLRNADSSLSELKANLTDYQGKSDFKCEITCVSEVGMMTDVISGITNKADIELIVMGTHGASKLETFLIGNHARRMINATNIPLLLVPESAAIKPVKKVAFATDLEHAERDLEAIFALIPLLKRLNAELLLVHIYDYGHAAHNLKDHMQSLLAELSNKADYPNIFYRAVNSANAESGLDWLTKHGDIDILTMIHRKHQLFDKIFKGSHTQKMANHVDIPLLVIPEK